MTQIFALISYLAAIALVGRGQDDAVASRRLQVLAAVAIAAHGYVLQQTVFSSPQLSLGLSGALSLFFWQCAMIHLLSCLRYPLWHLAPAVWTLAAGGIVVGWLLPAGNPSSVNIDLALRVHIFLSMTAWALLTLAALQLIALALLDRRLRQHTQAGPPAVPLQTMENLAFGLIGAGFAGLCLSIASGFLFVDDFMAQHLVHKTVLSLIACAIFAALLIGRMLRGWRGKAAIRWALGGYASLLLAYFGSKFVLEQLLGRAWG